MNWGQQTQPVCFVCWLHWCAMQKRTGTQAIPGESRQMAMSSTCSSSCRLSFFRPTWNFTRGSSSSRVWPAENGKQTQESALSSSPMLGKILIWHVWRNRKCVYMPLAGFLLSWLAKISQQCACKKDTLGGNVGVFAQQLPFQVFIIFIYVNTILTLSSGVVTDEATDPL